MKIHEYQAKELLRGFGVAVPRGKVITTAAEAAEVAREFGGRAVVKAQIHAGGRGQGGGVKLAKTPEEASAHAQQILGMTLVTHAIEDDAKVQLARDVGRLLHQHLAHQPPLGTGLVRPLWRRLRARGAAGRSAHAQRGRGGGVGRRERDAGFGPCADGGSNRRLRQGPGGSRGDDGQVDHPQGPHQITKRKS